MVDLYKNSNDIGLNLITRQNFFQFMLMQEVFEKSIPMMFVSKDMADNAIVPSGSLFRTQEFMGSVPGCAINCSSTEPSCTENLILTR